MRNILKKIIVLAFVLIPTFVLAQGLDAEFKADVTSINAGDTVNFTDLSAGYNIIEWSWTFEGGSPSSSTSQNPSVTYNTAGIHDVSLTVSNRRRSSTETKTAYITVMGDTGVSGGYMLLAPLQSTNTYLVDTDESIVHTWTNTKQPGNVAYLLEDEILLRTGSLMNGNRFAGTGGFGGIVEKIDWNSNVIWSYTIADDESCSHHDVEALPNGNILMIAWEYKSASEAEAAGRNPSLLSEGELWPDKIIEVDPNTDNIVWEWHVWDHLIQDHDASKPNYGVVADHPERINLNHVNNPAGVADWNHTNSVDYNEEFDQIILSVHGFGEFWVIDHSTTTAEAGSHSGGNYGKGGDILYRWGNPSTYGAAGDREFFGQHDAQWIESDLPGAGNILVFNNGQGRPEGNYSTVEEIIPDVNADGSYPIPIGGAFGPESQEWVYMAPDPTDFYAQMISGAQRLSNGNTLICQGPIGYIFEVTDDGTIVWTYQNIDGTSVFRAYKYPYDYSGFSELDQ
ncbi:MAG: PKD domain-containing protein [Desulfobacteraceae bacterium]|nr:PKD domain-containing protein [Desulfobacteraceae bacterium]